jgi:internalin A
MRRMLCLLVFAALLHGAGDTDWIRKLGGKVEQDAAGNVLAVNLSGSWINDTEMLSLASFPKLERLDLSHTRISDEGLLHLRPAKQIRDLNLLYAEQITDLGLNAIKGWTNLQRLNVRGTRIADPTLAIVSKLAQIESLDIANTGITEAGLDNLVSLTRLKHLVVGRSRFSDEALGVLRLLNTLESLDLSGPRGVSRTQRSEGGQVSEALVRSISELKELKTLRLGHNLVSAQELAGLMPSLQKLEKLGLEACPRIDDNALEVLAAWKSLKYVDVQETKVTRAGVEQLRKNKPDLIILSGPLEEPPSKNPAQPSGQNAR